MNNINIGEFVPRFNYYSYEEIPELYKDCILVVSEEKHIENIPLNDINGYFKMMCETVT